MSTKKIRELCEAVEQNPAMSSASKAMAREALAEVEAIEKAAPAIVAGVLDMQTGMEPLPGFGKALAVIQAIAKESGK